MNFYNPYFYSNPITNAATSNLTRPGLFRSLFSRGLGNFSLANLLNGAQRTLNVANQSINLVRQVHPMINNAKTMFKVMNEFKKDDNASLKKPTNFENKVSTNDSEVIETPSSFSGPTFFQ